MAEEAKGGDVMDGGAVGAEVSDYDILKQQDAIKAELESQPRLGPLEPLDILLEEYRDNEDFLKNIDGLIASYGGMRRARGDGNCFYRSFLFSLLLSLLPAYAEDGSGDGTEKAAAQARAEALMTMITTSTEWLTKLGYEEYTFSMFHEAFVDELNTLPLKSEAGLENDFNDPEIEQYIVWYCRLLTAAHLKLHPDAFAPFIDAMYPGKDVHSFCRTEVEPTDKECDQIQIMALAEAFSVCVKIVYLDRSEGGMPTEHIIPDGGEPVVTVLYRPGHYDVLYPKMD
eukprot:PLAT820.1.p1 GENE.PLAT820.1~~PLAT820.1.p1  ORF type:complete len:285 (+),score=141.16 PLAT820.1:29-883(+)